MAANIAPGICAGCHGEFPKNRMTKHIADCAQAKAGNHDWLHILVQGLYDPGYWLHVGAQHTTRLRHLDYFLREIWLECCGHMSEFVIGGGRYLPEQTGYLDRESGSMELALREVLQPGIKFTYTYDFGTPTELSLRVLAERQGGPVKGRVTLLARNRPYEFPCEVCGSPASQLCTNCSGEGRGWMCETCASKHECGEEMILPIVNSPRMGTCGYTG